MFSDFLLFCIFLVIVPFNISLLTDACYKKSTHISRRECSKVKKKSGFPQSHSLLTCAFVCVCILPDIFYICKHLHLYLYLHIHHTNEIIPYMLFSNISLLLLLTNISLHSIPSYSVFCSIPIFRCTIIISTSYPFTAI